MKKSTKPVKLVPVYWCHVCDHVGTRESFVYVTSYGTPNVKCPKCDAGGTNVTAEMDIVKE